MTIRRILTRVTASMLIVGTVAVVACGTESESLTQDSDAEKKTPTSTTIEPDAPLSMGVPALGSTGIDEMIVISDGSTNDRDDSEGAPIADGEVIEGAGLVEVSVLDLPESDVDPVVGGEVPNPLPVKEVPDGSGLIANPTLNPDTCEGVLSPPREPFELRTHSATDPASADNPAITSMCVAYYTSATNENFLSVAVVMMSNTEAAADHYDVVSGEFDANGSFFDEQRSRDRDWLTAKADEGGIGTMVVLRVGSKVVSIHNGPSSEQSPWQTDLMLELAHDVIDRLPAA